MSLFLYSYAAVDPLQWDLDMFLQEDDNDSTTNGYVYISGSISTLFHVNWCKIRFFVNFFLTQSHARNLSWFQSTMDFKPDFGSEKNSPKIEFLTNLHGTKFSVLILRVLPFHWYQNFCHPFGRTLSKLFAYENRREVIFYWTSRKF